MASFKQRCLDESMIPHWVCDQMKPDDLIIKECLEMMGIIEQERLFHGLAWPVWYQRLVKAYCAIEDGKNAAK